MILYDFCLLPAQFSDEIINVGNLESHMQFADRCAPWKMSNSAQNLVLQAAISINKCLPQIPRRGRHKSLLT
jgi:hypothetical protein